MTVADSPKCVAYHFREKRRIIGCAVSDKDCKFDLDYLKRYTLALANRADKTKTQRRICNEITQCTSFADLLYIVDRVILHGEHTKFMNYKS